MTTDDQIQTVELNSGWSSVETIIDPNSSSSRYLSCGSQFFFNFSPITREIHVFDVLNLTKNKLCPQGEFGANGNRRFLGFLPLTETRGFVWFSDTEGKTFAQLVHLDSQLGTFKPLGVAVHIGGVRHHGFMAQRVSEKQVVVQFGLKEDVPRSIGRLVLFEAVRDFKTIRVIKERLLESTRSFTWFNLVEPKTLVFFEKPVFSLRLRFTQPFIWDLIEDTIQQPETKEETVQVRDVLKTPIYNSESFGQGQWVVDRLVVGFNFEFQDDSRSEDPEVVFRHHYFLFYWTSRSWFKLQLKVGHVAGAQQLGGDSTILLVLNYEKNPQDRELRFRRIPIRRPETLHLLAVFALRRSRRSLGSDLDVIV